MAISARRFKFLDQETNLPTQDLLSIKDNQVYNNIAAQVTSSLTGIKDASGVLGKLNGSLSQLNTVLSGALGDKASRAISGQLSKLASELDKGLNEAITQGVSGLSSELQSKVNGVVNKLGDIKMPSAISGAVNALTSVNLSGVQDFYKDALKIGGPMLSQGGDLLKIATDGLKVTDNLMTGLTGNLSLNFADQIGDITDQFEFKSIGNIAKLEKLMPDSLGVYLDPSNVYDKFTSLCGENLTASLSLSIPTIPATDDLMSLLTGGDPQSVITSLRSGEVDYFQKEEILAKLDEAIASVLETDPQFNSLLQTRADVKKIPFISQERRDVNLEYSNLSDQLGSMSKSLLTVDLNSVDRFNFTQEQNDVFTKLETYQTQVKSNVDLCTRDNSANSFSDLDFSTLLPELTPQELATLKNKEPSTAHRVHDLHPTVSVFLGDDHGFTAA